MLREVRGALTALALVLCGVLALVSFDLGIPGQDLLQSLRFHIAAALAGLVILLFVSRAWWRASLLLVPLLASVGQGGLVIYAQQQQRIAAAPSGSTPLFRLLSFNVLNVNTRGSDLADYIIGSGADIVMLMEAGPVAAERERLFAAYPYNSGCLDRRDCSTVILSKWPLSDYAARGLSQLWPNRLVTAVADIRGTKVNLVLSHLTKPYFDEWAAGEVYRISRVIHYMEGPVLLAGDFNAAAWSANINRLANWAGLAPGPGYPATWPVPFGLLGVPIDNVFTRAPLVVEKVEAMPDSIGSNHRGLIAEIGLANPS
jgi:endonuclease/exonuclease/phosphatase (EEP) superfamily protein YafD